MESFLNRYRNITVLLLVIFAQLILLAVQVKNGRDVRMIRVWSVTAVSPVAQFIETVRGGTIGLVKNYITLRDMNAQNRRLQAEVDRLRLDNIFLKNELNTADRAKALQVFQTQVRSRTVAATVIGTGPGATSKVVFVDRGSASGVKRGMGVVTPDGIVGKVFEAYPTASEVLLITDPNFAAGVISQKTGVRGTAKGTGTPLCKVDYIPMEEKVQPGEWVYTSGDDRIFPRGFPVGIVKVSRDAQPYREVYIEPAGTQHGLSDVLILVDPVHQEIPAEPPQNQQVFVAPPPAQGQAGQEGTAQGAGTPPPPVSGGTEADKLKRLYKETGDAQGHVFGEGLPGSKPPDFTHLGQPPQPAAPAGASKSGTPPAQGAAPANPNPKTAVPPGGAAPKAAPAVPGAVPKSQAPTPARQSLPPTAGSPVSPARPGASAPAGPPAAPAGQPAGTTTR